MSLSRRSFVGQLLASTALIGNEPKAEDQVDLSHLPKDEVMLILNFKSKVGYKRPPKGQKFRIGDIVRITDPKSWFAKTVKGQLFEVQYSDDERCGHKDEDSEATVYESGMSYGLRNLATGRENAWYKEHEFTLVVPAKSMKKMKDRDD